MNFFRPAPRYAHGEIVEIDGRPVRLKVDGRARAVSVRISAAGEVVATAPNPRLLPDAIAFTASRAAWIDKRMTNRPAPQALNAGGTLTIAGAPCVIEEKPGRGRLAREEEAWRLTAPPGERFASTVTRLLKGEALRVLSERTAAHAATLGQPTPVVGLGDPKSRWGSCSQPRRRLFGPPVSASIRYSWRLILAPYAVLDYVAAHECAHLVEGNHGPRFWALVEQLRPDWKAQRKWLRANGEGLHAFGL